MMEIWGCAMSVFHCVFCGHDTEGHDHEAVRDRGRPAVRAVCADCGHDKRVLFLSDRSRFAFMRDIISDRAIDIRPAAVDIQPPAN